MPGKKVDSEPTVSVTGACSLSGRFENFVVTCDDIPVSALNDSERLKYLLTSKFLEHLRSFVLIPRHYKVSTDV